MPKHFLNTLLYMDIPSMGRHLTGMRLKELVDQLAMPEIQLDILLSDTPPGTREVHQGLVQLVTDWSSILATNKGSSHNHQPWMGGLADHLADMLRLGTVEYIVRRHLWGPRPYNMQSIVKVVLLHDAEKFLRYADTDIPITWPWHPRLKAYEEDYAKSKDHERWEYLKHEIIRDWNTRYNLNISDAEYNALEFAHGENPSNHKKDSRAMNELASLLHAIDNASARDGHSSNQHLG